MKRKDPLKEIKATASCIATLAAKDSGHRFGSPEYSNAFTAAYAEEIRRFADATGTEINVWACLGS